MKKVLFGLFAVMSMAAFAGEYNVYIKGGTNLTGGVTSDDLELGKTISIVDDQDKNKFEGNNAVCTFEKITKLIKGLNLGVEGTYNVNKQVEVGAGVKFVSNKALEYKVAKKGEDESVTLKNVSYNSVPLYATAKFNFGEFSGIKPYAKADLGYTLNVSFDKGQHCKIDSGTNKPSSEDREKLKDHKLSNGLYAGAAVGVEYSNFIGELGVHYTGAKLVNDDNNPAEFKVIDVNNTTVSANIGYKFNF